jgi:hypothetical protein
MPPSRIAAQSFVCGEQAARQRDLVLTYSVAAFIFLASNISSISLNAALSALLIWIKDGACDGLGQKLPCRSTALTEARDIRRRRVGCSLTERS